MVHRRGRTRPRWPGVVSAASLVALLMSGCAKTYSEVRVSAARDPGQVGRTYWLVPYAAGVHEGQLQYRQLAALVDKALAARGYERVDERTEPHLVILLGYGVGPPQTEVKQTSGAIPTTETTTTYRPPPGGGVGSTTFTHFHRTTVSTTYPSWITLSAVNGPAYVASGQLREVWVTTALTYGEEPYAGYLFPVMLASAMDYFGQRIAGEAIVRVPYRSQRVYWLVGEE
jgi:hypothetical protein